VANLTPDQLRTRERVETLIRLMAPGLNLVLGVGERISRLVEGEDTEYYPVQTGRERRAPQDGGAGAPT
jgi:hypothetical protein